MPRIDPNIPVFPGHAVFGNTLELRRDRLETFRRIQRLGNVALIHIGRRPVIVTSDPEMIQGILVDHAYDFIKGFNYEFLKRLLGLGLVTSEAELHKRQRKLVAPALTPKRIANYADTMASFTERAQEAWADGATIDVTAEMMSLTLEVVAKTLFDTSLRDASETIARTFQVGAHWVLDEAERLVHFPYAIPFPRNLRMRAAMRRMDAVVSRLIAERRASGDSGDILSMLLAAKDDTDGRGMTDQQIRDEAITMIFAGHETTANGLAWTFYLLAQHPEVLAKLRAEVDGVLGGRPPALADLPRLPYTMQVFKESMRRYPPAPIIARRATKPMRLAGYDLDAGQGIAISIYGMHHRPDFFPEPDRFDPERFAPENEKKLPRHAFLPFATGPRVCIGNHFALMEGQIILAHLVQRVDLSLVPGANVVPFPAITLRAQNGIPMRVTRRKTAPARAATGA